MDAKKRKAAPALALRKKPRRDKSEFVSVEVGLREFKKRMASGSKVTGETNAEVEDLTQEVRARARVRPNAAAARKPAAKKAEQKKAISTARKAPAKKTAAAARKTPVKKAATAVAANKTPVKRTTRATKTAEKLTLAQVKAQLEREQQQRVEQRIQTLHRSVKPTPTRAASAPAAPVNVTAIVHSAGLSVQPATMTASSVDQQQNCGKAMIEAAAPSSAHPPAARSLVLDTQPNAHQSAPISASADLATSSALLSSSPKNEFITDDLDEDLLFAMALEEVEQKLAIPLKTPPATKPAGVATDTKSVASASMQAPVSSPVLAKSEPAVEPPAPIPSANQAQPIKAVAQTNDAAPVAALAPGVLEEMERLRRENELLRRSNERLQAAVTSPTQTEVRSEGHRSCSPEKSRAPDSNRPVASRKDALPSASTASSTARYLNLTRCDSDQDMQRTASALEDESAEAGATDSHSTAAQDVHVDRQCKDVQVGANAGVTKDGVSLGDQRKPDHELEPATEQMTATATDHSLELSSGVTSQEQGPPTPPSDHSSAGTKDDHASVDANAAVCEADQVVEKPSVEEVPSTEFSPSVESVIERCVPATAGSDDGDVSDAGMSEADSEDDDNEEEYLQEEEGAQEEDDPVPRTSTIDSGNYSEYRVRQGDDLEDEDMDIDDSSNSKSALSDEALTSSVNANLPESSVVSEHDANQRPVTPVDSETLERTTAPSNTDEEEDGTGEDEDEAVIVQRVKRREVIALSSSSSESESESESDEDELNDTRNENELEAALRAAGGDSSRKSLPKPPSGVHGASISGPQRSKILHPVGASVPSPSVLMKGTSKKRRAPGLSRKPPSVKSSLLWPALDEFYDFLLDMSPENVHGTDQKRVHLHQYFGGKLPARHSSIENYCHVQLEAIMEELVASVSNTTDRRGGGGSGLTRQLSLTSVSPCGVQGPSASSLGLSFGAIFSESGFTGSTSSSNDYILTFDASALGKKSSSDFVSGDLVLVRSPRWKSYEMRVFGVVLCDSVVAVGGKSGPGAKGGGAGDSDQICVLIRPQHRDREDAVENFSVLTELCLSNQRVPNWRWTLQQVHNTTTSAREFQAIKSISFFPNDLKEMLLRGQIVPSDKTEQAAKKATSSSILSPRLLKFLKKHYNESQMQAILGCLGEDSRVIIQGPPGTGKTKTVLGLLSALLDGAGLSTLQKAKGTARIRVGASLQSARSSAVSKTVAETSIRVLVAAPSNAAVDELVVRVLSEGLFDGVKGESYRPRIVRVGRPDSSQQLSGLAAAREASESKKNRKEMRKYAREVEEVLLESLVTKHRSTFLTVKQARQAIIKNAQIVFCTLSGAGSVAMCEFAQDFDALIIDEAAQAVEASTLIPFKFRPHRVVLVGDHRQLPATVISKKLVSMGYDRSLQQRLDENDSPVLLLTQQYRMHPEIAEFPSTHFYGGRLVQDDNMREWTRQDYHRDRAFKPLLFLDVQGSQSQVSGSTSLRNLSEVEAVVQLVRRLLEKFPRIDWKKRIGVIAPYKQQIYEVRGAIGRLEAEFNRRLGIEVNTVDGFQGREKEIIIYSCVRTSHGGRKKKKRRGDNEDDDVLDAFWADERRMNVAITRAKSSLWIVGNSALLKQSRAWRALIQHTKDHKRYIADSASTLFASSSSKTSGKKERDASKTK